MKTTTSPVLVKDTDAEKLLGDLIKRDLDVLNYPKLNWVIARTSTRGERLLDVLIIGGGQSGLSAAFALMRDQVRNLLVVDENPQHREGPWLTFARMTTMRTPKHLTGPDLGIPSLTFRNWFETVYGKQNWDKIAFIAREHWAEYLQWYRNLLEIPVRNQTQAGAIEWNSQENCFAVPLTDRVSGAKEIVLARKIILATGFDGCGRWEVPALLSENLTRQHYAHTRDDIDFETLKGKSVALLGAGASAFDNASAALESGASQVQLFCRRAELPKINPYRWAEFVGFLKHHADLPDRMRWKFILQILRRGQLPPADTYGRATRHPNFKMYGNISWDSLAETNGQVEITTNQGKFKVDFIIAGTGCVTDLSLRPELANLVDKIALWSDRYTPEPEEQNEDLLRHPYLGPHSEFIEKNPGEAPYLSGIFNYTFGGLLSQGFGGANILGMKYYNQKLVSGITRQFYLEDAELYYRSLVNYDVQEF